MALYVRIENPLVIEDRAKMRSYLRENIKGFNDLETEKKRRAIAKARFVRTGKILLYGD